MIQRRSAIQWLITLTFALLLLTSEAAEPVAGAFLGATPADLEAAKFTRTRKGLPSPAWLHYSKATNDGVFIQVLFGDEDQPDPSAHTISVFKIFNLGEEDKCVAFLSDLYRYIVSSEKEALKPMKELPFVYGSNFREFGGTVINEAYSFNSGHRYIHYYCTVMKDQAGEKFRLDANMKLIDESIGRRAAEFMIQKRSRQNPTSQDPAK